MPTESQSAARDTLGSNLFAELSNDQLCALLDDRAVRAFEAGHRLIDQGTFGHEAYVLLSGRADVLRTDHEGVNRHVAELATGALFGEMALLDDFDDRRNASIVARESGKLLVLTREALHDVLDRGQRVESRLNAERRIRGSAAGVSRSPLYRLFAEGGQEFMAEMVRSFQPGEPVVREGDEALGMHIVLSGTAKVSKVLMGLELHLTELLPGACVGELALLEQSRHSATVRAISEMRTIFIAREYFNAVVDSVAVARSYFRSLRRFMEVPGGLLSQHVASWEGHRALRSTYDLSKGRQVIAYRVHGQGRHVLLEARSGELSPAERVWSWSDDQGRQMRLGLDWRGVPVEARVTSDFTHLKELYQCFIDQVTLPDHAGLHLQEHGRLPLPLPQLSRRPADELCSCLGLSRDRVRSTLKSLSSAGGGRSLVLGCGSVCESCKPELLQMMDA